MKLRKKVVGHGGLIKNVKAFMVIQNFKKRGVKKMLYFHGIEAKNVYELEPIHTNQKSFYKKAHVIEDKNGFKVLQSYDTYVAIIDRYGNFYQTWGGYSVTTMKHINDFIYQNGIDGGGKAWWDSLKCYEFHKVIEALKVDKKVA